MQREQLEAVLDQNLVKHPEDNMNNPGMSGAYRCGGTTLDVDAPGRYYRAVPPEGQQPAAKLWTFQFEDEQAAADVVQQARPADSTCAAADLPSPGVQWSPAELTEVPSADAGFVLSAPASRSISGNELEEPVRGCWLFVQVGPLLSVVEVVAQQQDLTTGECASLADSATMTLRA